MQTDLNMFAPVRFSTTNFPEQDRVAVWRELYGHTVFMEPAESASFACTMVSRSLPGLQLLSAKMSPVRVTRTREVVSGGNDDLILIINQTGTITASARSRDVVIREGDAVLTCSSDVTVGDRHVPGGSFAFRIPRSVLSSAVADIDDAVMRLVPRHAGVLNLLTGYAAPLLDETALTTPELQQTVVNHVYDLVALALGAARDVADVAMERGVRAAWLKSAKSYIINNSSRRDLSIGVVATHLRITSRYLQRLFESRGSTFSAFLLEQRLARARRMLTERRFVQSAISTIAYEVGFGDLSYFNRCFRQRYGATPSDIRAGAAKHQSSNDELMLSM